MYESHFGLSGSPFRLNPDPAFYFGSRGHSSALSYLKFGVFQSEGFVVVTGEIGAGKTTLVRTLLEGLESEEIAAAQIVSTQLEAGDLLRSVALAFGITAKDLSKAELIATIEAFLTHLVTQRKRALLIVDEAQNLSREAVEELRMLSNFQLGNQALLQTFLVGQPELRKLLVSKPMEQFRQRVIASCHLGPMDPAETRAYIEHRLHQVDWKGNPGFDDEAFARIFHWTHGIPRRVNMLCNRLLLSVYLASESRVTAKDVDVVGAELLGEVGESAQFGSRGDKGQGRGLGVVRRSDS
jgi:putative secretion ATPase (PEP-CTERM system associated)